MDTTTLVVDIRGGMIKCMKFSLPWTLQTRNILSTISWMVSFHIFTLLIERRVNSSRTFQYINVESILIHPQYAPGQTTLWANDYSLLRLVSPVTLSTTAGLVCLPPDVSQTFEGAGLITSGWGLIGSNQPLSPVLKAASMKGSSQSGCQSVWGSAVGPSHICAIGAPTNSSCKGDSGGLSFNFK